jgi:hypothetical protein
LYRLVVNLSLITATIPRTHSFWASLQTGKTSAHITQHEYDLSNSGSRERSGKRSNTIPGSSKNKSKQRDRKDLPFDFLPSGGARMSTHIYSNTANPHHSRDDLHDQTMMSSQMDEENSQSSLKERAEQHGVWRNCEVTVEIEYQDKNGNTPRSSQRTGRAI